LSELIEIPTPAARAISKAVRFARDFGGIVLFSVAGPRDTAAMRRFLRARRAATIILRCQTTTTAHVILRRLARQLELVPTGSRSRISGADLYKLLGKQLTGGRMLLVLDGAHRLTNTAFGLLRTLFNDHRLPVLLLTNEGSAPAVRRRMLKHLTWRAAQYPFGKRHD
jgi:hypothetical protein